MNGVNELSASSGINTQPTITIVPNSTASNQDKKKFVISRTNSHAPAQLASHLQTNGRDVISSPVTSSAFQQVNGHSSQALTSPVVVKKVQNGLGQPMKIVLTKGALKRKHGSIVQPAVNGHAQQNTTNPQQPATTPNAPRYTLSKHLPSHHTHLLQLCRCCHRPSRHRHNLPKHLPVTSRYHQN